MNDDELSLLNFESELDDPLDELDHVPAIAPPDPEAMLALLTAEDNAQRIIAARAFSEIRDPRAIPHLIRLLTDVCPLVRVSVAYGLGRNPSEAAVEPLIRQYYGDFNGYVRKGIVWALGNCRDRRAVQPLLHALKTDIPAVRLWAASGLAQIAHLDYNDIITALPPLIQSLHRDAIPAVRSNCAWAIGQLCRELPSNVVYATAIDALLESLVEDQDMGVTEDAKAALLKVGDPRGLQMIEDLELEGLV
ncbi:HEAT repeat domain-containing protein [Spirulina major CS-329]|jgi:HEAT repeat protein|uniref:HEAT repeat domain-containing protein n=1 Tax=Spirulina TaxID=1154 RepID=UPI000934D8AF|nr:MULTISPECIES: HEAT repeat domain-containing protein [Spirulina]MDB9495386.1 HEAT repeat domain-containing protein [Spirulina subsalsa CS-330]MDB9501931.1 HEAT repeat domain-containing protein [Spirulina major CS-329]